MGIAWLVLKYRVSRRRPPHPPVAGIQFQRDFWRGHARHRLEDERRFHSKEEANTVKQRIAEVLRDKGIVGNNGRFLPGAPSNVAIRTHILDRDRNPDGVDIRGRPLSNGNTIVGIVREHPDYPGTAKLETTMLRRDEWRGDMQQPWTPKALGVDRVFTHSDASGDDVGGTPEGMGYTQLKSDEPMDISFQLLKEDDFPRQTYEEMFNEPPPDIHPGHVSELGLKGDSSLSDESNRRANAYREAYIDGRYDPGEYGPWWQGLPKVTETLGTEEEDALFSTAGPYKIPVRSAATARRLLGRELPIRVQQARIQDDEAPSFYGFQFNDATHFTRSEPMDIAFQLLKERKSPEAMKRKLEYDKQYEKTPERRKYQRELHAERRKRGIYGTDDHMDVSHTQGGKLTLEPEHANRARHFKNQGTLRVV